MRTSIALVCGVALFSCLVVSCQSSRCIDVCPLGIARCASGGIEVCGKDPLTGCGSWLFSQCLAGEICSLQAGRCAPPTGGQCLNKEHSRRCVGQAVHWFDDCGAMGALVEQCPVDRPCQQGQCTGGGGTCPTICQAGQSRCTPEGWVSTCTTSPQSQCLAWSVPGVCPGNLRCVGDRCPATGSCPPQNHECQANATRCQGNSVEVCRSQQDGCHRWDPPAACASGQSCVAGQCQGGQGGQCPAACTNDAECAVAACGTRQQCFNGQCSIPQQAQCPASCSADSQCNIPACQGRTSCLQGSCQVPQAQCPASCTADGQCSVPACGNRTSCLQGSCQAPQAQCPASCTADSQCGIPACGNKTTCTSGQCAAASQITAEEQDLLDALNKARKANGLPDVTIDMKLMCAARVHAKDVGGNGSCGHVGTDGSWPWDRAQRCGFPQQKWTVNEIAAGPGFSDGDDAVRGWKASSGHWSAIVHQQAKTVGVAVYKSCYIAVFDCCVKGSD